MKRWPTGTGNCRKPSSAPGRLFESQGDLIVLRDAEGRITFANDAYCELAQMPRSALIGSRASADGSGTGRYRA